MARRVASRQDFSRLRDLGAEICRRHTTRDYKGYTLRNLDVVRRDVARTTRGSATNTKVIDSSQLISLRPSGTSGCLQLETSTRRRRLLSNKRVGVTPPSQLEHGGNVWVATQEAK